MSVSSGGAAESPCLERADLIVLCGVDPVEFIRKPWQYGAVIDVALAHHPIHYVDPAVGLYGICPSISLGWLPSRSPEWTRSEIDSLRRASDALRCRHADGIGPQEVVELAAAAAAQRGATHYGGRRCAYVLGDGILPGEAPWRADIQRLGDDGLRTAGGDWRRAARACRAGDRVYR
jgi:hypothetical protein